MYLSAPVPLFMYTNYLAAVREALEQQPTEWTFKSDPRYREILEHTPVEFAEQMLLWSIRAMPELDLEHVRSLCRLNDSLGQPVQHIIPELGFCSTSNMKYLCHAIKVWQHIDSLGLDAVDIVEIGGGYGGLALYIEGLRPYFKTEYESYVCFDLPEVGALQNRYAEALDLPLVAIDQASINLPMVSDTRYAISIYAFSEFDQPTRDWYAARVLKQCGHGLIIWNFPEALQDRDGRAFGGPPYQFVEWPLTVVPDEPRLYEGHLMVTW